MEYQVTESRWHAENIAQALNEMEAGEAGNDQHYRAIKALAAAVGWLLTEAELKAKSKAA